MDEQSGESKEEEVIGAGKGESGIENKVVLQYRDQIDLESYAY